MSGAQELYECLLGSGRLAEQLHDAVHDFLLAGAPASQPAAGAEPGPAPASYLRLAQRVLLLLPDADLLAFATRLLPWPGGAGARCRGAAGGGAPAQAVRLGRAREPARRGAAWVTLSCKPGSPASVGRRAGRACQPARLGRPPGPLLTCSIPLRVVHRHRHQSSLRSASRFVRTRRSAGGPSAGGAMTTECCGGRRLRRRSARRAGRAWMTCCCMRRRAWMARARCACCTKRSGRMSCR